MIVVSDTSPLTNLAAIGQLDVLRLLFGALHIGAEELGDSSLAEPERLVLEVDLDPGCALRSRVEDDLPLARLGVVAHVGLLTPS